MIDTAGTLTQAAQLLHTSGAKRVIACATHGVFSGPAIERMNNSILEEICVTDSIPQHENQKLCPKLVVISIVPLIAQTILHLHEEKSLSMLFDLEK
jgi:ribose-phosphate pyrophosphokinase